MAETRKQRKLHFDCEDNIRQRFTVSSTPIKSDESESPPSSTGSYEKMLEVTETSEDLRGLILNMEDLSEDVYEMKQNFVEQNIKLEQFLVSIDSKLSNIKKPAVEEEESGFERCDSFVFRGQNSKGTSTLEAVASDSDSDEDSDYPDVMNISRSLNSIMGNVSHPNGSLMQEVDTIEGKLEKFQTFLQEQRSEIARLELMKDALLLQNERMLKNQRKLEEEQSVTVKIIESKDQEISMLRKMLGKGDEVKGEMREMLGDEGKGEVEPGLGLYLSAGRELVRDNWTSLLNYLVRDHRPQQQTSWTGRLISLPARLLTVILSNIL